MNLLSPVDCLDVEACEPRWGRIDKTNIDRLRHLVIDEKKIGQERLLFRAKHYKRAIVVHRSLANSVDATACTGHRWVELTDYPEA